ncbi:MAG: hypothetical protein JXA30_12405 [Deltaproteobacteria bacterium]|nr:hypothetical protein [Deltaproteobacteria bacterium]
MTKRSVAITYYVATLSLAACAPANEPTTGSQTNWLTRCRADSDCGELECLCGACTRSCSDDPSCGELPGASCVASDDAAAIALCAGTRSTSRGLCLLPCPAEGCANGMTCVAGVCMPTLEQTALVSVDESQRFQTLVGFGANIGYVNEEMARHPRKEALFDAMFSGTGLNVLRLRNRYYGQDDDEDLGYSGDIVTAATERQGRNPTIILSSASPPDSLKANGSSWCEGNPDTCTLATLPDGSFDYAGFARYWRASLDAYALAGIEPDYISIQKNPNWAPETGAIVEACRFLPAEGTATVTTDAGEVTVQYPGYSEAMLAVIGQFEGLASIPRIVAPDTSGFVEVADYVAEIDIENVDAIAHHMYGTDTINVDRTALKAVGDLAKQSQRPLFQTEMSADALTTAVLMHAALATEGAVLYLQAGFVGSAFRIEPDRTTLINLTDDDFVIGDPYHVMLHYSAHVEPGWVRVAADSDTDGLLASAWVPPGGDAVTVVLTNPLLEEKVVRIDVGEETTKKSRVTRTVLSGRERSAPLGPLPPEGIITLPGHSLITVTIQR